jgi:preprotein translocase subunit SecD
MTCSSTIDESKIQLSSDSSESAENIAIALNSALTGNALKVTYSDIEDVNASTATAGENAALLTFVASLVILVLAIVLLCVKYKKLGGVLSLISVLFALVIVYALYILDIQLTFVGLLTAIFGLAVFITTNLIVFEEIRRQTSVGKTMQASIKAGYKRTIFAVLDIHIILLVASILATVVGVGEVATCGFIMIIATIASYILYWFTRLMWYVISSPARDKFKFGGYKRVVYDD